MPPFAELRQRSLGVRHLCEDTLRMHEKKFPSLRRCYFFASTVEKTTASLLLKSLHRMRHSALCEMNLLRSPRKTSRSRKNNKRAELPGF